MKKDAVTRFTDEVQASYNRMHRQIRREIIDECAAAVDSVFDDLIDELLASPAKQALRTARQRILALKESNL